jgi:hypothetical protein
MSAVTRCGAAVFMSLRGSRGGHRAIRWGSWAHRAVARHEGDGGGWCGGAPRQRRCSAGRPWLNEGPAAPEEGGDGEDSSKSKQCRAVAVLTMNRGGNVMAVEIRPLPTSSGTTAWTRHRPGRLVGDGAQFWWLSCGEEGGVGERCSATPHAKAKEKLGEEMGLS